MSAVNSVAPLRIINIAPLYLNHREEIVADLLRLQWECGITDVAFQMSLAPEECIPSMTQPECLRDLFIALRRPLEDSGLRIGILMQTTLGHGGYPDIDSDKFTRRVNAAGTLLDSLCPLDHELQDYLEKAVATVAAARPDFMILDDDFRLANGFSPGCFCPLHLAALEKVSGRRHTRESLLAGIAGKDQESLKLKNLWEEVRRQSLLELARRIRKSISAADPKITCGYCVCDACAMELQFAHDIQRTISADTPPFVRMNNAFYMSEHSPQILLSRLYWSFAQMDRLREFPEILGEADTHPRNRYATSCRMLDLNITFSLLSGCSGVKLWITRLFGTLESDSGTAYRRMLQKRIGAYRELRRVVGSTRWSGPTVPLPYDNAEIPADSNPIRTNNWTAAAMARLGIPARVGYNDESSVFMLTGAEIELFSDAELKYFLSRSALLDGAAAIALSRRGMSEWIGVKAAPPPLDWNKVNLEMIGDDPINGRASGREFNASPKAELRSCPGAEIRILSSCRWAPFNRSPERREMAPASLLFENSLGGRVAIFAGSATSMMNEIRREQLYHIVDWLNRSPLPVKVDSDLDVFAMHGQIGQEAGGGELLAVFNLNLDPLDELKLELGKANISGIFQLGDDATWNECRWQMTEEKKLLAEVVIESAASMVFLIKRTSE